VETEAFIFRGHRHCKERHFVFESLYYCVNFVVKKRGEIYIEVQLNWDTLFLYITTTNMTGLPHLHSTAPHIFPKLQTCSTDKELGW
jgi:hypothetical protein